MENKEKEILKLINDIKISNYFTVNLKSSYTNCEKQYGYFYKVPDLYAEICGYGYLHDENIKIFASLMKGFGFKYSHSTKNHRVFKKEINND